MLVLKAGWCLRQVGAYGRLVLLAGACLGQVGD